MSRRHSATDLVDLATELNSVAIHLHRRLRDTDRRLGVSSPRLSALSVLVFGGPRTLGQLATDEGVRAPTMSRLVTALEAEGLVQRRPVVDDARAVRISATRRGRRLLLRARDLRVEQLVVELARLPAADHATLAEAAAILRTLERSNAAPGED